MLILQFDVQIHEKDTKKSIWMLVVNFELRSIHINFLNELARL